jgi:hypothetical protein
MIYTSIFEDELGNVNYLNNKDLYDCFLNILDNVDPNYVYKLVFRFSNNVMAYEYRMSNHV